MDKISEATPNQTTIIALQQVEIDRLRDMCIRREEFIAQNNLWKEFSQWLAEPEETKC